MTLSKNGNSGQYINCNNMAQGQTKQEIWLRMLNWILNKLQKRAGILSARARHESLSGDKISPSQIIDELVREGYQFHTSGNLDRAEAAYRKILYREPRHADTLYLLGEIQQRRGLYDEAASLMRKAIEANPNIGAFHTSLAVLYRKTHDLNAAEASFKEALKLDPSDVECLNDMGTLFQEQHRYDEALEYYERALTRNPKLPEALFNKGVIYRQQGRMDQAATCFELGVAQKPDEATVYLDLAEIYLLLGKKDRVLECFRKAFIGNGRLDIEREREINAYFEWGNLLLEKQQPQEAVIQFLHALDLDRGRFSTWVNLGNAYRESKQFEESINCYIESIKLSLLCPQAYGNIGISLTELGSDTRAKQVYQDIVRLRPDVAWPPIDENDPFCELDIALNLNNYAISVDPTVSDFALNLGVIFEEKGLFAKSLDCYEQALALGSDLPHTHFNKGVSLLRLGQFETGWDEYEARMKLGNNINLATLDAAPLWQGEPLSDSVLLVHAEQGLGDSIQFIRYLTVVNERCSNVIIECQPAVKALIESIPGIKNVYAAGSPLPKFDYQVPFLSLPRIFGTRLDSITADTPYIFPDPKKSDTWQGKISGYPGLKVGIVWAGGAVFAGNRFRSCSLQIFAPLAEVEGVTFFSLQKGSPEQEAKTPPLGMNLQNFSAQLHDFCDTAALIDNLDLVITVDTSVAHLAGAMGKPVWTLIPFCPDWRWLLDRNDSPWYPSMRLFRQPEIGKWDEPIAQIKTDLAKLSKKHTLTL